MREIGSELQVAFHIVWVLFHHSTPLKFDGDAEDVFPGQGDGVSPLAQVSNYSNQAANALTSLPSESEDTDTNKSPWSAARMAAFASGSLFPDTRRNPSESSVRIDCTVRAATGKKRLGDDSSGLRRRCSCNGGREAMGDKKV